RSRSKQSPGSRAVSGFMDHCTSLVLDEDGRLAMKRSIDRFARPAALAAALMLFALPAFAAEAAEAEPGVFAGDIGNALWTLVIFGLVVFVLGKFAWGPILKGLQSREDFIHKSLADAKADREAAEARLREYTEKLTTAR